MKVLVTGVAGKLGRLVAKRLAEYDYEVIGVDRRPWPHPPEFVRTYAVDLRKRHATEVFRTERPEVVVHMATVSNLTNRRQDDRFRINLVGTQAVFDAASRFGAQSVIFLGRHTFYGAVPDAPLYHVETDPPMAVSSFPALGDLVAADLYAGSAIWRFPHMRTCILRFCYTLGASHHGTLASYLENRKVPTILGYDPLFQFIHEEDVAEAITAAIRSEITGVYNVSGPDPLPLSTLIKGVERTQVPLLQTLLKPLLGKFGFPWLPHAALDHLKYPIVVDSSSFRRATGWRHVYSPSETMDAFLWKEPINQEAGDRPKEGQSQERNPQEEG